jgi:hypothetical protein
MVCPLGAGRLLVALCLLSFAALAANLKLYLKDGDYHVVREYQVQGDRVRFYSIERSGWEEMPLELVDLKRTEAEVRERQAALAEEAKILTAEDQAERQQQEELQRVPRNPGVYLIEGGELKPIKQAESKAVTNKGRSVLKIISPIPVVAGQTTVELDGERSANVVSSPQPEFYFRPALNERFAIFKLTPKKNARVVQKWNILPLTDEVVEDQEEVPILRQQLDEDIYKIWPKEPLKPGEYAVVEYTAGRRNIQIWDFAYRPARKPR